MGNESSCKCVRLKQKSPFKQSAVIQVINNDFHVKGKFNFQKQSTFKKLQIAASQFCASSGIGIQYSPLIMRLLAFKHQNVFKAFATLSRQNRIQFIDRIGDIYLDLMDSLYQKLILNQDRQKVFKQIAKDHLETCQGIDSQKLKVQDKMDLINKGVHLLRTSKVAVVFMCGGASSRFFFQDKFLSPLELEEETELLAILFKKLRTNYRQLDYQKIIDIPIVVIGNQSNTLQIEQYLKANTFFNFNKQNIFFSDIPSLAILDEQGKICLNFQYNYLRRPQGSACYVEQILHPRALQILEKKGVQYVHFIGTQNLAQSPSDPLFIGLTNVLKRQVAIKCTDIEYPNESFDRIVKSKNRIYILDNSSFKHLKQKDLYHAPIAMNSMIFSLNSLSNVMQEYYNHIYLAGLYRVNEIYQNIYDFSLRKPLIHRKCYVFQKDIKDIISFTKFPLILKVNRKQFIPIITAKQEYSIKQACQTYQKKYPQNKKIQTLDYQLSFPTLGEVTKYKY